ncbi:MAG TPA: hypothetical protein VK614_13090 [Allosphingosinicella sp.]|nr:hypothetical protein [Allosphingosinicella sp.]
MILRPVTLILAAIAMSAAGTASAQTQTSPPAYVTMVKTGWGMDSFMVVTPGQLVNPAGCRNPPLMPAPEGYISDVSMPGHQTYYLAALAAITSHLRVVITVNNNRCFLGRPVLIGINLLAGP